MDGVARFVFAIGVGLTVLGILIIVELIRKRDR